MKPRICKKDLNRIFHLYCTNLGKKVGNNDGEMDLDFNKVYGGYKVVYITENGHKTNVFLETRLKLREMYYTLYFANNTLNAYKYSDEFKSKEDLVTK